MVEELNSGLPRTNPDSGRVKDLNQGPPDFKPSALNHSATPPPTKRVPMFTRATDSYFFGILNPEKVPVQQIFSVLNSALQYLELRPVHPSFPDYFTFFGGGREGTEVTSI